MNTPINRLGLSRTTGSVKKRSGVLTPSTTPKSTQNTSQNTPLSSSRRTFMKKTAITKKKLEFAAHQHLETENDKERDKLEPKDLDFESLKALVEDKRKQLAILERHEAEKEELTQLTEQWKQAGLDCIEQLRKFVNPPPSDEEILDNFKIQHEYFL